MSNEIMDKGARLAVIEYRIHQHFACAAENLLGIGQCLNEAKNDGLVPHGEWEGWVLANTGFSVRQAQRLMKAAQEVPAGSVLAQLPFSKMQAVLQLPAPEREAMAQKAQDNGLSLRELQAEIEREKKRSAVLLEKCNRDSARAAEANKAANAAEDEAERLRDELAKVKRAAKLAPATGISAEAQKEIDQLQAELEETEAALTRQANLRKETQQELLNLKAAAARGETGGEDSGLNAFALAAAVRAFIGAAGVLPHMGAALEKMTAAEINQIGGYVGMVAEWVETSQRALDAARDAKRGGVRVIVNE